MTLDEFKEALRSSNENEVCARCLDPAQIPYVFDEQAEAWESFKSEVATSIGADPTDVRVVGSGLFGFSMKPSNNFRQFQDTSDIDIVVVNENLFDLVWQNLLRAAYPRPPATGAALRQRQKTIYTGWIMPADIRFDHRMEGGKVRPALEFKSRWFDTFKRAARHAVLRHEDVKARLYRSWPHVELYHQHGLRALRNTMERTTP